MSYLREAQKNNSAKFKIGIDFDNTIVDYNKILAEETYRRGWIQSGVIKTKEGIRNHIFCLPGGEKKWIELQGLLYGELIHEAGIIEGVSEFIAACYHNHIPVFIISQKTEYATLGFPARNLRQAAFNWLEKHEFFDAEKFGLNRVNVFFEDTLERKIQRIATTGCTHFIDDLEKVLNHPDFPKHVVRILFTHRLVTSQGLSYQKFSSWKDIEGAIFNHAYSRRYP